MTDPKLLNEIRSIKYAIVFAACLIGFSVSMGHPRADLAAMLCALLGIAALVGAMTCKYHRR